MSEEKKEKLTDTDVLKELTKAVTELADEVKKLSKEWEKWRKAGKF